MKYIHKQNYSPDNLAVVIIGAVLYWALFLTILELSKVNPLPLVTLPFAASCWLWGIKRGFLAGIFTMLGSFFFIAVFHTHHADTGSVILTLVLSAALGTAAGWIRKLYDREKRLSGILSLNRSDLLEEIIRHRKIEERVLWDEYFLKTMSNSSPLGMLAINNSTDEVLYCNHRFCEIWKVEKYEQKVAIKELKSSEFLELCHANLQDFDFYKKHFSPALDVKSLDTKTIDIQFKDGRTIRRFTSAIMSKNDEYLGRLFLYDDVTERIKSEYLLKRSSDYERLIYEITNMFVQEPAGRIDEVFISTLRKAGEFLGMDMGYFYRVNMEPGIAENLYEWRSNILKHEPERIFSLNISLSEAFMEKLRNFERIVIPDTEALPSDMSIEKDFMLKRGIKAIVTFPVAFNSNLIGFLGFSSRSPKKFPETAAKMLMIISDIFAGAFMRKLKTDELLESEERFRLLVQNSADMITVIDSEGHLIYTSEAVGRTLGYNSGERTGASIFSFVHPDDVKIIKDTLKMLSGKTISASREQHIRVRHTNGEWIYLESIFNDQTDNPAIRGIVINSRDETKRKELEQEINNALQREKELNMLKSKFVSMVSHEYRTPLTAILSSAELIDLFGPDMDITEMREYLDNIVKSVDYLTSLLDDVLLINRAESGRLEYNPSTFELMEFLKEILKDLKDGTECSVELKTALSSKMVIMDKKLLRHILMNLLSNAVKYSNEGETVSFIVSFSQGNVNFEIEDNGIGISSEDQPHLFEPFFRGDNVSNIPGTGLGLSIVKNCVELHHGSISFESRAGKGTTFHVSLPEKRNKL